MFTGKKQPERDPVTGSTKEELQAQLAALQAKLAL
jgi:hypothetical protein